MKQSFDEIAEIWYQRTKNLAAYYRDDTNPPLNRVKAYLLYKIMEQRVFRCLDVYTGARIVRPINFKPGGIV